MRHTEKLVACLMIFNMFGNAFNAHAEAETTAQICNAAGVCGTVDPLTALIIIGAKTVGDEIKKGDKGFGPNGAIMKAVNTVLADLQRGGLGPTNDLVKAWETIRQDLLNGPGSNNDVIKALESMNIKL